MAKGFNIESYQIWVYDTWGNVIWYSDKLYNGQPSEGWDGTYKGQVLKSDSYIWKARASFLDGTQWDGQSENGAPVKKFGNVMLLR